MALTKHKIDFDPAAPGAHDRIGAFITDGTDNLAVNGDGSINSVVTATDLDIRDLDAAQDNVAISDGTDTLAINGDGSINSVVTATNLDIRDLVNTQDSIAIGDETNIVDLQQMDAAFGVTSWGFPIFGVRRDADTSPVSATGDAHPLVFNAFGELKVDASVGSLVADDDADTGNPIKVGGRAQDVASGLSELSAAGDRFDLSGDLFRRVFTNNAYNVDWSAATIAVSTTAVQLDASKLNGRVGILVQNLGDKTMYLGASSGVLTSTGLQLPKNSTIDLPFGESLDVYAIGESGSSSEDLRIVQFA